MVAVSRTRLLLWILIPLMLFSAAAAGGAAWWVQQVYTSPGPLQEDRRLVIPTGSSVTGILQMLFEADIIATPLAVKAMLWWTGEGSQLKAGEYAFTAGMSPQAALGVIIRGEQVVRKFTAAEGLTTHAILKALQETEGLTGRAEGLYGEGMLLPETYHFHYGEARNAVAKRMHANMQSTLKALWKQRQPDLPLQSPEEALILASIVEKETGIPEERAHVASVFINRLRLGMKLQSDPTTIYALTEGKEELGRSLTRKDLQIDSPYNTYVAAGLPPGPIACPGQDSIAAVLHPKQTQDLYFVATGNGGHAFAGTLKEHNRNVRAYRSALRNHK